MPTMPWLSARRAHLLLYIVPKLIIVDDGRLPPSFAHRRTFDPLRPLGDAGVTSSNRIVIFGRSGWPMRALCSLHFEVRSVRTVRKWYKMTCTWSSLSIDMTRSAISLVARRVRGIPHMGTSPLTTCLGSIAFLLKVQTRAFTREVVMEGRCSFGPPWAINQLDLVQTFECAMWWNPHA